MTKIIRDFSFNTLIGRVRDNFSTALVTPCTARSKMAGCLLVNRSLSKKIKELYVMKLDSFGSSFAIRNSNRIRTIYTLQ